MKIKTGIPCSNMKEFDSIMFGDKAEVKNMMTDNDLIRTLLDAMKLAEATFLKLHPQKMEERRWVIDAVERLGKAMATAEFMRARP